MIPQNVVQFRGSHRSRAFYQMIEPLKTVGSGGDLVRGQHGIEFKCDFLRVDHNIFCRTGMYGASADRYTDCGGVEVLILDFVRRSAVHRVGECGVETGNVEEIGPLADFLIRCECDAERTVGEVPGLYDFQRGHDLGDSGFVVGAEQGRAVRCDQCVPDEIFHERVQCRIKRESGAAERDRRTVPAAHNLRLYTGSGGGVGCVEMCDESECGRGFASFRCGEPCVNIRVFRHLDLCGSEPAQFFCKMFCKHALLCCGRMGAGGFIGLRIECGIIKQTFQNGSHCFFPFSEWFAAAVLCRRIR